jgi:hypothetical protein
MEEGVWAVPCSPLLGTCAFRHAASGIVGRNAWTQHSAQGRVCAYVLVCVCDNQCDWIIESIMHDCRLVAVGGVVGENAGTQNSAQGRVCVCVFVLVCVFILVCV